MGSVWHILTLNYLGILNNFLKNFLETNIPKNKNAVLGVSEDKLGSAIQSTLGIKCEKTKSVVEHIRCIRLHFGVFLKQLVGDKLKKDDLTTAQRGMAHSYSRSKIKYNVNKADNMITQAITLLDQLNKDLNTFSMRFRDWYSRHFPELSRLVSDNIMFVRCAMLIRNRREFKEDSMPELIEIVENEDLAKEIYSATKSSMGTDISEIDLIPINNFSSKIINLAQYKASLESYLSTRMHEVAPNLSTFLGDTMAARLISKAGSLISLTKYPASTIQILGAEKALFRALKARSNKTPKYGILFNTSYIGKAKLKDKGKISRCVANCCSLISNIDSFSDKPTTLYGEMFKNHVEERIKFYETGKPPRKNMDVMREVIEQLKSEETEDEAMEKEVSPTKDDDEEQVNGETPKKRKRDKKEKKDKKDKKDKKEKKEKEKRRKSRKSE